MVEKTCAWIPIIDASPTVACGIPLGPFVRKPFIFTEMETHKLQPPADVWALVLTQYKVNKSYIVAP